MYQIRFPLFTVVVLYSSFHCVVLLLRPQVSYCWVFTAGPRRGSLAGVGASDLGRTARIPFLYLSLCSCSLLFLIYIVRTVQRNVERINFYDARKDFYSAEVNWIGYVLATKSSCHHKQEVAEPWKDPGTLKMRFSNASSPCQASPGEALL